jgi:hypothetical protein
MSDVTAARRFVQPEEPEAPTFVITLGDLRRDWTLSLEARERILTECAKRWGWSHEELVTNILALRAGAASSGLDRKEPEDTCDGS